ncbi:MAG: hypothetical protein NW241_04995 [Bacteroidia bacterium]|nr:hypothetical protein [Bacteroidia bacterium]
MLRTWLIRLFWALAALLLAAAGWAGWNFRDRFPEYEVRLRVEAPAPRTVRVGFARYSITPPVEDTWTDRDGNAAYDPKADGPYEDRNGNGRFDAFWMAGFGQARAAAGIHDSLWARAIVIDDGQTRIALVSIDAIGFGHDEVIRVRKLIPADAEIDYAMLTSTHVHEAPDLMGLWGPGSFRSGVNPAYMAMVQQRAAQAVAAAAGRLRPARLRFAQDLSGAAPLVGDTRDPQVLDPGIYLMQAVDQEADTTLGTLMVWGNHPETLWADNLLITSDFPHYFREGVERGVHRGDSLLAPGIGGICVYVNGAIGGLMTTHPEIGVPDLWSDTVYTAPSFDKARAQGERLALLALGALGQAETVEQAGIGLRARTLDLPLDNSLFRLAAAMGTLQRGMSTWMHVRSEVAVWTLGPASFLLVPGEIYPEIVNGGIVAPETGDFQGAPVEVPALRERMPGTYRFVLGLANDEVGYIIPRTEWDTQAPFLGGASEGPYGEIVSLGPETAPILHRALLELLEP